MSRDNKYCKRCDQTLPVKNFSVSSVSASGYQTYCKSCTSAYNKEKAAAREAKNPGYDKRKAAEYRSNNREAIRKRQREWYDEHAEYSRERSREWYYNNQDRVIHVYLTNKHGISYDEFKEQLSKQGGGCAICESPTPKKKGRFSIDHDHSCCPKDQSCFRCRRGLLCSHCNVGLGHFQDDIALLTKAINYLKDHRESGALQETEERPGW